MNQWEKEILETEKAFARLVQEQGRKAGFLTFAADGAVLQRGNTLIRGKEEIAAYYDRQSDERVRLEWEPEYVRVSAGGDLGYTYGKYIYEGTDEAGAAVRAEGIFHTVWRREPNGAWRYVWD
jgi:ketosteroid isomerase-like protein